MRYILKHRTKIGTFYIVQSPDGRFHPVFDEESLGSYAHIEQAIDDLVLDATFSVSHPVTSERVDTSTLGLPEDPREWEKV